MAIQSKTDQEIRARHTENPKDALGLLAPLMELSEQSSTLILGFGGGQQSIRQEMIPYFHVCGPTSGHEPIRALIIGGWVGTESESSFLVARLVAAIEQQLRLVTGIEVTAYPVANVEAHRAGEFLTAKQQIEGIHLWQESACTHVRVLERELQRYDYDVVILLRERLAASDLKAEIWPGTHEQSVILQDALERLSLHAPAFSYQVNPTQPAFERALTPLPGDAAQPAELIIGLGSTHEEDGQTDLGVDILLSILHAFRQARLEEVL